MRLRKVHNIYGGRRHWFSGVIFLKFRADYQMSTKSSNSLQVEDIDVFHK